MLASSLLRDRDKCSGDFGGCMDREHTHSLYQEMQRHLGMAYIIMQLSVCGLHISFGKQRPPQGRGRGNGVVRIHMHFSSFKLKPLGHVGDYNKKQDKV